jgi:hypothetical protein
MILGKTYKFPDIDMAMEELMWTETKVGIYKHRNPNILLESSTQLLIGQDGIYLDFILMTEDDARRYNEANSREA